LASNAETDLAIAGEIAERYVARSAYHAQRAAKMALKAALIAPERMLVAICSRNSRA